MTTDFSWLGGKEQMHDYLQCKLESCSNILDLIPFIKHLIPFNEIKHKLSSLLTQQLSTSNHPKSFEFIFESINKLNGNPSDDVHAHIISYLPSTDYKDLPLVSTHFRDILHKYPYIYNEKRYSVKINLTSNQSNTYWYIYADHNNKIIRLERTNDKHKMININNMRIPIHRIHQWQIIGTSKYIECPFNDQLPIQLLSRNDNNINGLILHCMNDKKLLNSLSETVLNHCYGLYVMHSPSIRAIDNRFKHLQCLEFITFNLKNDMNAINNILNNSSETLIAIQLIDLSSISIYDDIQNDNISNINNIKIPCNVQWISIKYFSLYRNNSLFTIDLTECNKLIGMVIRSTDINCIKWPINYIIPFVDSDCNQQLKNQHAPIRCLTFTSGHDNGYDQELKYKLNEIKRTDPSKCLYLNHDQLNDKLFYNLMQFVFEESRIRNYTISKYLHLFKLNFALWVKNIHDSLFRV